MTANAMTTLSVMTGAERLSLESPVPSTGHAGFGGGREETYWAPVTRLTPILPHTETRTNVPLDRKSDPAGELVLRRAPEMVYAPENILPDPLQYPGGH
jgi:hypothetical protein